MKQNYEKSKNQKKKRGKNSLEALRQKLLSKYFYSLLRLTRAIHLYYVRATISKLHNHDFQELWTTYYFDEGCHQCHLEQFLDCHCDQTFWQPPTSMVDYVI